MTLGALGVTRGWIFAIIAGMGGAMVPGFWLTRQTKLRQKVIRNGLPDALDLLIVCLEAGSSLDQGIVKASDELEIAYPPLAEELRMTTEIGRASRGWKPSRTSPPGPRSTTCGRWWPCWSRPIASARALPRRCARTPRPRGSSDAER